MVVLLRLEDTFVDSKDSGVDALQPMFTVVFWANGEERVDSESEMSLPKLLEQALLAPLAVSGSDPNVLSGCNIWLSFAGGVGAGRAGRFVFELELDECEEVLFIILSIENARAFLVDIFLLKQCL